MNTFLTAFQNLKTIVSNILESLKLSERKNPKGRKPVLTVSESVTAAVFWRRQNIGSKKSLYEILEPPLSYNRFVAAINDTKKALSMIILLIMKFLRNQSHFIKFTDSTDIPVCLNKNAKKHKTMSGLAEWSKTSKGWFYGLKLHLTGDFDGKVLALSFTPGNSSERKLFRKLNNKLKGLFVADAGYISSSLGNEFHIPNERYLVTALRSNMKKLATEGQIALLNLRMKVEIHFRVLKLCYGLVTSLPRSVDGYLTHYLAAIVAMLIA